MKKIKIACNTGVKEVEVFKESEFFALTENINALVTIQAKRETDKRFKTIGIWKDYSFQDVANVIYASTFPLFRVDDVLGNLRERHVTTEFKTKLRDNKYCITHKLTGYVILTVNKKKDFEPLSNELSRIIDWNSSLPNVLNERMKPYRSQLNEIKRVYQ